MTYLTKDEVSIEQLKREICSMQPVISQLDRLINLCRADLVAEVERLEEDCATHMRVALAAIADVVALKAERDDWKARALKAEQAQQAVIVLPREMDEDLYYTVGGALGAQSPEQCGRADSLWEKLVERADSDAAQKKPTTQPQPAAQEPVKFLANSTRFKMSFFRNENCDGDYTEGTHVTCFDGYEKVLDGCWVALVAAEDDCHLKLATPPSAVPVVEPTDEEDDPLLSGDDMMESSS